MPSTMKQIPAFFLWALNHLKLDSGDSCLFSLFEGLVVAKDASNGETMLTNMESNQ